MHALIPYYKNTAFVRDGDCMELAESFIGGIEACVLFNLPLNSSLLNTWPDAPLQLSGMYVPPLISCPIASGIDVVNSVEAQYLPRASDIATNDGKHIPIPSDQCYMTAITNSPFACLPESGMQSHFGVDTSEDCGQELNDDIEHDVRLNALLSKVDEIKQRETDGTESPAIDTAEAISELYIIDNTTYQTASTNSDAGDSAITSEANQSFGNTFTYNRGWSTVDGEENTEAEKNENFIVDERLAERAGEKSSGSNSSLRKAMVRKYQFSLLHSIDFDEVWQRFEETAGLKRFKTHATKPNDATEPDEHPTIEHDDSNLDEYVVVQDETDRLLKKFTLKEIQDMVQQIYIIPRQLGLDAQNFACVSCENPLGVGAAGIATAQLCAFTGLYFCSGCMAYELHEIPSRVISNWDFQKYPISQRAAAFLNEFRYHGFIDMKILNPDIYRYVNEMSELQSLRIQLNFIRAYLFTCSESIVEGLQEQMCNREYLYEHIHRYSLSDIEIIPKGILADQIRRVISFGKQHIFNCTLCSQKGYICEICHCSRILYPFNVQTTIKVIQIFPPFLVCCSCVIQNNVRSILSVYLSATSAVRFSMPNAVLATLATRKPVQNARDNVFANMNRIWSERNNICTFPRR